MADEYWPITSHDVVIVTGANSGIGSATAHALAATGARAVDPASPGAHSGTSSERFGTPANLCYTGGMLQTVTWGVIGAGDVCERKSGPPLYELPGSELTAVYRRNQAKAADFVRRHGHGRVAATLNDLLADESINAVYVASPHALHAEHTIAALEAGKHVLVEKPMALSVTECDRMIAAARNARVSSQAAEATSNPASVPAPSLAVAYYRRGYSSVQRLRTLIEDGAIGTARRVSINTEFPTSHRIDLIHYLLGPVAGVRRIAKSGANGYRFEQTMPLIHLETESGVEVRMAEQWVETGAPESIWIEGDDGTLHLEDLKAGRLTILRGGDHTHERCGSLPWTHWGLIENFVAHIREGEPLLCDGGAGRESTVILERIDEALTA